MKPNRFVDKAPASLHFLRFPTVFENPVKAECLNCQSELVLIQPDVDLPERLLGVCESCKHWYLIDLVRELNEGIIVWLPDNEVVRELSCDNPPAGISLLKSKTKDELPPPPGPSENPGTLT